VTYAPPRPAAASAVDVARRVLARSRRVPPPRQGSRAPRASTAATWSATACSERSASLRAFW